MNHTQTADHLAAYLRDDGMNTGSFSQQAGGAGDLRGVSGVRAKRRLDDADSGAPRHRHGQWRGWLEWYGQQA